MRDGNQIADTFNNYGNEYAADDQGQQTGSYEGQQIGEQDEVIV